MPLYAVNIVLLLLVLVIGKTSMGATRWLNLGFFNLQPSELMKIMIIFILARHFSSRDPLGGYDLRLLMTPATLLAVPALLIMKQPDLVITSYSTHSTKIYEQQQFAKLAQDCC